MQRLIKSFTFIFLGLLLSLSVACNIATTKTTTILEVSEVGIDEENSGIKITVSITDNTITSITHYGLVIRYGDIKSLSDMVKKDSASNLYLYEIELEECVDNKYLYILKEEILNNLTNSITIRPYYIEKTGEEETIVYAKNSNNYKLSTLVIDENGELGKQILQANGLDKRIYEVRITLDTTNYEVSCGESENYTVEFKKPFDYIDIITIITCKEDYSFSNNVKFFVNDKEVTSKFVIDETGKLVYTIEDPNWTDIY